MKNSVRITLRYILKIIVVIAFIIESIEIDCLPIKFHANEDALRPQATQKTGTALPQDIVGPSETEGPYGVILIRFPGFALAPVSPALRSSEYRVATQLSVEGHLPLFTFGGRRADSTVW